MQLTANFFHWANFDVFIGSDAIQGSFYFLENDFLQFQPNSTVSYCISGSLILMERNNFSLGVTGKYHYSKADMNNLANNYVEIPFTNKTGWESKTYQGSIQASYRLGYLIPYLGYTYEALDAYLTYLPEAFSKQESVQASIINSNGVVTGISVAGVEFFTISGEVRLFNEKAISSQITVVF